MLERLWEIINDICELGSLGQTFYNKFSRFNPILGLIFKVLAVPKKFNFPLYCVIM